MGLEELNVALRAPVTVHGKNGKHLMLRPLGVGGMLRLKDWVKNKPFREMLAMIQGQGLEPAVKAELLRDARAEGAAIQAEMIEGGADSQIRFMLEIASTEGLRFIVKLMSEENHPGLSDDELIAFVDESNSDEVLLQISEILRPSGATDPMKDSSRKAATRKNRRKSRERS